MGEICHIRSVVSLVVAVNQVDLLKVAQVYTLFRDLVNKFKLIEHLYIRAWKNYFKVNFRKSK